MTDGRTGRMNVPWVRLALASTLVLWLPVTSLAASYTFTKIADTTGPFGNFGPFASLISPSINVDGTVAFIATLDSGVQGVFTGGGGPITTIADTLGPFSFFSLNAPSISAGGAVTFLGFPDAGGSGIFVGSGGPITTIADSNGPFAEFGFNDPAINSAGTVAFAAGLDGGATGIFTGSGGPIATIADQNGPFSFFNTLVDISDGGTVAFRADLDSGGDGIFKGDGGPVTTIAGPNDPLALFDRDPSINTAGVVAFVATDVTTGHRGVFAGNGGPVTAIVDETGPFVSFDSASINAAGVVAFRRFPDAGGSGIFTGTDPVADEVIGSGDLLFGSMVTGLIFGSEGLNDRGQVAFIAVLDDGTRGVYRADPVQWPATLLLLGAGLAALAGLTRRPRRRRPESRARWRAMRGG